MTTVTITYGEVSEHHAGMQKVGEECESGLEFEDLEQAHDYFLSGGYKCEIHHLNDLLPEGVEADAAYLLVVRNGANLFGDADAFLAEQRSLEWGTKALMRGRVVNKKARWNLCYAPESQDPDYGAGKGRIVAFEDVPELERIREKLSVLFGEKADNLYAEGNLYYDTGKCYIGWHGDGERKIVIAVRLGESMPLYYRWYQRSNIISDHLKIDLHHGDLYAMSTKATGNDWLKKKKPTLRHAAGMVKDMIPKKVPETRAEELGLLKVTDLKAILRERGLRVGGRKAMLIDRILEAEE